MSLRIPNWSWIEWLQTGINFFIIIVGCIFIGIMVLIMIQHPTDMLLNLVFAVLAAAFVMNGLNNQSILINQNKSKELFKKLDEIQKQLDRIENK